MACRGMGPEAAGTSMNPELRFVLTVSLAIPLSVALVSLSGCQGGPEKSKGDSAAEPGKAVAKAAAQI